MRTKTDRYADGLVSETKLFDPINIDDMSIDPRDYDSAQEIFGMLQQAAIFKARAIRHRMNGRIQEARHYEVKIDGIHDRLPEWARW